MAEEKTTSEVQPEAVPPEAHPPNAQFRDKRVLPEGVVPRQAQGYVIAGLAVLILLAVMFSKNHARPVPKETLSTQATVSNNMNQQKIQELEQNLSADQRQSRQREQAQKENVAGPVSGNSSASPADGIAPATQLPPQTQSPGEPIADAEKALAFKARFASNLVAPTDATSPVVTSADFAGANAHAGQQNAPFLNHPASASQQPATAASKRAPEVNINAAHGQPYVIFEGTTIDTVLTNRLDGEFAGPVKVMVTNPVYSRDGQHVLIPAGTFILGNVQKVSSFGQKRLAVTFHRMIMPDGYSVDLDQFHGLDQIGDTGLTDKVNNHYLEIFGTSIALGVISGAAEATTNGGYSESGSDMYRQGMASSLSQSSANVLNRFINVPPTITIREGHRIKVYLTQDMLLPAYEY
ncbi:MAG: TrbI/VirB10 family protein, partial [Acidobacteriaceae bacterium]